MEEDDFLMSSVNDIQELVLRPLPTEAVLLCAVWAGRSVFPG